MDKKTQQELIDEFIANSRPLVVEKTEFLMARVNLIKELEQEPSNKRYRLINFENHWIRRNQE
jgi:hypothetical protein